MPEFQFADLADFLAMGGHAYFVWMSYGFFFLVLAFNLWLPRHQRSRLLRLLRARQTRQAASGGPPPARPAAPKTNTPEGA
jgi:heme exporter protein D